MSNVILRAADLHKSYRMGRAVVRVLRGASITAQRGEFLVIMGASGSGKSTLLHILGALDIPDRGSVEFNGKIIIEGRGPGDDGTGKRVLGHYAEYQLYRMMIDRGDVARGVYRNQQVGFVFQFYHLLPELNVLENVMIPRLITHSSWKWWGVRRQARRDAEEMLERVGLCDRTKHRPNELSGGERQRVAIARALINRPSLLLADEPTGNLDETIGTEILKLLAGLNEAGQTIIMVTHDAKVAARAHRQVRLSEGAIREVNHEEGLRTPISRTTRKAIP